MTYIIHTDGGSRGNPGQAAIGVVIQKQSSLIANYGKRLGVTTNNVAEYFAVKDALLFVISNNMERDDIDFFLDSELVVKQLNGVYKIKDKTLQTYSSDIKILITKWGREVRFTHVKREQNKQADRLVNEALDNSSL